MTDQCIEIIEIHKQSQSLISSLKHVLRMLLTFLLDIQFRPLLYGSLSMLTLVYCVSDLLVIIQKV